MSNNGSPNDSDRRDDQVWIEMSSSRSASQASGSRHSALDVESKDSDQFYEKRSNSILTLESMRQMLSSFSSHAAPPDPVGSNDAGSRTPKWHRSARFALRCLVHFANLVLRVWALAIYFEAKRTNIATMQCIWEFLGIVISVQVCCQDADVQRWIGSVPWLLYIPGALIIYTIFGVCQVIHLKRAWARQLHVANVIATLDEKDFLWTGPGLGAEQALPVALLTGVPFALVSLYGFLTLEHADESFLVLWFATLSALLVVSMGVVEVDVAVSSYVAKRYHFDPRRRGSRAGRLQCMYPVFHVLFRTAEVLMRISFLMMFMVLMIEYFKDVEYIGELGGKFFSLLIIFVDFLMAVFILHMFSPNSEGFFVHVFAGVGLVLANVVFFVDMPGFCRPARLVSHCLEGWRVVQLILFVTFVLVLQDQKWRYSEVKKDPQYVRLYHGYWLIFSSCAVHTLLRLSPLALKKGDDLHTAVLRHHHERVKKLLEAGSGGEMLDVNGRMKDKRQATPAMLAAGTGNVEALQLLVGAGARVHMRNASGETVLHYAVKTLHVEALQFLLSQRGSRTVLRNNLQSLRDLAEQSSKRLDPQRRLHLLSLLEPQNRHSISNADSENNLASVRPEQARGRHLGNLFPDAVKDEIPPCSELHSVSGLVVAHAVGKLSSIVLRKEKREDDALGRRASSVSQAVNLSGDGPAVKLESLRRVGKLGQGAFGAVIEVEVMENGDSLTSYSAATPFGSTFSLAKRLISGDQRATSMRNLDSRRSLTTSLTTSPNDPSASYTPEQPKRFAMKLQPKTQANVQWQACSELLALKRAIHPFIVRLEQAFQTPQFFALLLEFCPGGDMNRLLLNTKNADDSCPGLPAEICARYVGQVLLALAHLHEVLGIVYRDVKPENILIATKDVAKLADFGSAVYVGNSQRKRMSVVGTAGFLAPELVFGVEDGEEDSDDKVNPFKTDAYSLGVTLEVMLLGEDACEIIDDQDGGRWMVPNAGSEEERREKQQEKKKAGRLQAEAYDLLLKLSPHRPDERSCLADDAVKNHPFFLTNLGCKDLAGHLMARKLSTPNVTPGREVSVKESLPTQW